MGALIILVVFILAICAIPVGIAYGANASRKSKRKKIEDRLPSSVTYTAAVRINTDKKQHAFMKLKAFEYAGLLYIDGNKVSISGCSGQHDEFDLRTADIRWVGIQAQNGALEWFSIKDTTSRKTIFVNGETGILVFNLAKTYPSTREIYSNVMNEHSFLNTPPPAPSGTFATPPPVVPQS